MWNSPVRFADPWGLIADDFQTEKGWAWTQITVLRSGIRNTARTLRVGIYNNGRKSVKRTRPVFPVAARAMRRRRVRTMNGRGG